MQTLSPNTVLQGGRYTIQSVLGQGGFGVTYLAIQSGLDRKVAIKEFFMKDYCNREESTSHVSVASEGSQELVERYRDKFLKEARNLARLNHPNIVKILEVFEENGTAYYVMEYAEKGSLSDKVKKEGNLSEPVATRYILQVASALDYIHQQKMNHLDVKPANIMLNNNDESLLIDFGLSKQYDAKTGNQTSSTPVGISEGYAPVEQYKQGGVVEFSPETDIYALGATFYKLLTGETPPSASDLFEEGFSADGLIAKGVSPTAIDVITKAMEPRKKDRMKSAREFMNVLQVKAGSESSEETVMAEQPHMDVEKKTKEEVKTISQQQPVEETRIEEMIEEEVATVQEENSGAEPLVSQVEEEPQSENSDKEETTNSIKTLLGIVAGAVVAIAFCFYMFNGSGEKEEKQTSAMHDSINASYSNGVLSVNGTTYNMVKVDHGSFTMSKNRMGAHEITLTKDYYIGETEVTQALWVAVMGSNPSQFKGDRHPVELVSYNDCQNFIKKLNELTGKNFRLPTEAEWEYAAIGGNKSRGYKYSGDNKLNDIAWFEDNSNGTTHDVGLKSPNELGIYDMSGNVSELCGDWYANYGNHSQTDPKGPSSDIYGENRLIILRGGNFYDNKAFGNYQVHNAEDGKMYQFYEDFGTNLCTVARTHSDVTEKQFYIGFRLALSE